MKKYIRDNKYLFALAGLNFLLIYLSSFNGSYGYFIDEFYYIACANHPALGYVDHPPLAPLALTVITFLFGSSIAVIRFLPALAASATVFLTGRLAGKMGGGSYARVLAATAMICNPVALAFGGFYSMNAFEPLFTVILALIIIDIISTQNTALWIWGGAVMGLGIMNKHTFVIGAAALILALIISGQYRILLNKWFFAGCGVAFLIVLPNIIWQAANGFPSAEFYNNITYKKNVYTPPAAFVTGQIINMSPAAVFIWIAGAVYPIIKKERRRFSFISVFFIIIFLFMLLSATSRADRTLFAYPAVLAAGALYYEQLLSKFRFRILKMILPLLLLFFCLLSLPLILPYFSYEQTAEYVKITGMNTELEKGKKPPLPQLLADRIGWREKCDLFYKEYDALPEKIKKEALVYADNYGKAGALELWGKEHGIKEAFCTHNSYFLWGKNRFNPKALIVLDDSRSVSGYLEAFDSVSIGTGRFYSPYVSYHENSLVVIKCFYPLINLDSAFIKGKRYF
jgi:hypothetical protein